MERIRTKQPKHSIHNCAKVKRDHRSTPYIDSNLDPIQGWGLMSPKTIGVVQPQIGCLQRRFQQTDKRQSKTKPNKGDEDEDGSALFQKSFVPADERPPYRSTSRR